MNTHIMSNEKIYWFIFYNDQLLIEKKNGKYQIPYTPESPIKREMDIPVLNVPVPGYQAKTFRVTKPISVSEQYEWIGLRSSYDYLHITQPEKPLKFSIGTKTVGSVRYAET